MSVLTFDLVERRTFVKIPHRVAAHQVEIGGICQLVPEGLETNSRCFKPVFPEQLDHLSIGANGALSVYAADLCQHRSDSTPKRTWVRHSVPHQRIQRGSRIDCHE